MILLHPLPAYLHKLQSRGLAERALAALCQHFEEFERQQRRELLRKVEEADLRPAIGFCAGELCAERRFERGKSSLSPIARWSDEEIIEAARNQFERKH